MRINFTEKLFKDILVNGYSGTIITDCTGLAATIRKCNNGYSIHFQCKVQKDKVRKTYSLGKYPDVSVATARSKYLRYTEDLKNNRDPIEKNTYEKGSITVGNAWQQFTDYKFTDLQDKTKRKYISLWDNHLSRFTDVQLKEFTPKYTLNVIQPYLEQKLYDTARRITGMLKVLIDYAVFLEELPYNPIAKINNFIPSVKRKHIATFSDDNLQQSLEQLFEDMSSCSKNIQMLLYMYFFTLLRNIELRTLKTSDIHGDYITVKTKTLERFKQPLTTQAQRVIDYMLKHKVQNTEYVFEANAGLGYFSEFTLNKALDSKGYKDKLRVHGIRSCGRQWLQELPFVKESIIELCLSHTAGNAVQQAYNRGEYVEEKRKALQAFSDFIEQCSKGHFEKLFIE